MGVRYRRIVLVDHATGAPLATVPAQHDATVYAAFDHAGQRLPTTCRGSAICGLCRVEVRDGAVAPATRDPDEQALLARVAPDEPHARLACRIRPAAGEERLELEISGERWRRAEALRR